MKEFFAMGGYAFYVWVSYGIALVVLVANVVIPLTQRRRMMADIARRRRRERRAETRSGSDGQESRPEKHPTPDRDAD